MRIALLIVCIQYGIFTMEAKKLVEIFMGENTWHHEKCKNSEYRGMIVEQIVS